MNQISIILRIYLNGIFITNISAPQNFYNTTGLTPNTTYEISTRTVDNNGNINTTWVNDTATTLPIPDVTIPDKTPPSNITNLNSISGTTWLNWTWTNPSDSDFNHTEIYLNYTFITNITTPQNYFNITGLSPDTLYELGTRTVDTSGNINETWVNATARTLPLSDTTPPTITFISPTDPNGTVLTTRNWTFINVSLSEPGLSWLEWNGTNETMSGSGTDWYINKTDLANGVHTYRIWANDSAGNVNVSETRTIEVNYITDVLPPIITIVSPVNNTTYIKDSIDLNYSVNEPTMWEGYSLDGAGNITLNGNTTLIGLVDGVHTLTVYANDTSGNMNLSTVWFTIDTTPPVIESITLYPANTTAGSRINISVRASDNVGVLNVTAGNMQLINSSLWEGSITAASAVGKYNVIIRAKDAAGNAAEKTASYSVVNPVGGISVTSIPKPLVINLSISSSGMLNIKLNSTANIDDVVELTINTNGLSSTNAINLSWFNRTFVRVQVPARKTVYVPFMVTVPSGTPAGYKAFKANAKSLGLNATSVDTGVVNVRI